MPKYLYAYNPGSQGAKELGIALGIQRIKNENSRFVGGKNKIVINWGASELPEQVLRSTIINHPDRVKEATDKLSFFRKIASFKGHFLPDWTTDHKEAISWCAEGATVVARTVLRGHSGNGIRIMEPDKPETFVKAPLYTKYIPKNEEYRVHIVKGDVIDIQRKILPKERAEDQKPINWKVRNLANGFIYVREGVNPEKTVLDAARHTMEASGLDFGAVDIVCHNKTKRPYVLEINTAPGLEGQTVQSYARALT